MKVVLRIIQSLLWRKKLSRKMNVFYVETIQKKPVFISLNRVVMVFISVMSAQINRGDVL